MNSSITNYTGFLGKLRKDPKSCWFLKDLCVDVDFGDLEGETEISIDVEELKKHLTEAKTAQYIQITSNDDNHISDIIEFMGREEFRIAIKDSQCVAMTIYVSDDYYPDMDDFKTITDSLQSILKEGSTILWGCSLANEEERFFEIDLLGLK